MDGAAGSTVADVAPNGWTAILAYYGNLPEYVREDGTLDPRWESEHLKLARLPWPLALSWDRTKAVRWIRVHRRLVSLVELTFEALSHGGFESEVTELGGAFAFRPQRGSHKLSLHSFGAAIDLNPRTNPLGEPGDMHPGVVEVFERYGWTWGGRWSRPDPMHFQFARGW